MTGELLGLALEYGWGCTKCRGRGVSAYLMSSESCSDCHGNRVTKADQAEFERLVVAKLRQYKASHASVLDSLRIDPSSSSEGIRR